MSLPQIVELATTVPQIPEVLGDNGNLGNADQLQLSRAEIQATAAEQLRLMYEGGETIALAFQTLNDLKEGRITQNQAENCLTYLSPEYEYVPPLREYAVSAPSLIDRARNRLGGTVTNEDRQDIPSNPITTANIILDTFHFAANQPPPKTADLANRQRYVYAKIFAAAKIYRDFTERKRENPDIALAAVNAQTLQQVVELFGNGQPVDQEEPVLPTEEKFADYLKLIKELESSKDSATRPIPHKLEKYLILSSENGINPRLKLIDYRILSHTNKAIQDYARALDADDATELGRANNKFLELTLLCIKAKSVATVVAWALKTALDLDNSDIQTATDNLLRMASNLLPQTPVEEAIMQVTNEAIHDIRDEMPNLDLSNQQANLLAAHLVYLNEMIQYQTRNS